MGSAVSVIIALSGFACDRVSKILAQKKLAGKDRSIAGGKVNLMIRTNSGFAGNRAEGRRKLIVTVSVVVFVLLMSVYIPILANDRFKAYRLGFSLLFAGAAGNSYDRIVHKEVTDFINVCFLKRLVFNLADVFLVVGGLMTALVSLTGK